MSSRLKAARPSIAQTLAPKPAPARKAHPFLKLNVQYQVPAGADPGELHEDADMLTTWARELLETVKHELDDERLHAISELLNMARAAKEAAWAEEDRRRAVAGGAK